MDKFKIQEINGGTCDQEMLKYGVNNFANNFNEVKDPGNFIRIGVKDDDQPGNIQHQQEKKPGLVPNLYYKVPGQVKRNEQSIQNKDVA